MKNCKSIEKKLIAYLHGELAPRDAEKMQVHLDGCDSCRAALEAQRAALELLGDVLGAAPAPERLVAKRPAPAPAPVHRPTFADIWFSPRFKAVCYTSVFAVAFLFFSGTLVVYQVLPKAPVCFEPPPQVVSLPYDEPSFSAVSVRRPNMPLKKLKPPTEGEGSEKPRLRRRITAQKKSFADIEMPEVAGVRGGLGNMGGDGLGSLGFDVADTSDHFGDTVSENIVGYSALEAGSVVRSASAVHAAGLRREPQRSDGLERDAVQGALFAKGQRLYAEGDFDQAGKAFEAMLVNDPYNTSAMVELKKTAERQNEMDAQGSAASRAVAMADMEASWNVEPGIRGAEVPNAPLEKYKVRTKKPDKPKATAKLSGVVKDLDIAAISFPDLPSSGIGMGFSDDGYVLGTSGYSVGAEAEKKSEVSIEAAFVDLDLKGGSYFFAESFGITDEAGARTDSMDQSMDKLLADDRSGLAIDQLSEPLVTTKSGIPEKVDLNGERLGMKEEGGSDDLFGGSFAAEESKMVPDPDVVPDRLKERKPAEFNAYVPAAENAFSTFSIDVDTAAYGLARQQLLAGALPEPESVRTEEFINSFDYDYRPPAGGQTFAVHSEMAPSPFRTGMDLLKIGIKGRRIGRDDHRGAMLTLVIDTSGSMSTPERMGLVKQSLALLLDELDPADEVAIVQFGGEARLVLDHTPAGQKETLLNAVTQLQPGGPTQFDQGLGLGYDMATSGFKAGASNRIIVMSDGVANIGELDPEAMLEKVGEHRRKGIYLSVLGFGAGTYDDDLLERLANRGDGMYAYIDSLDEARRLLVDQLAATLHVIASDVKIQVEFNPERVVQYRQLGYENRQLTKEQFRDDTVDAGEVGSGQSVTALYDVQLDPAGDPEEPIATVYVRYRRADNGAIEEISSSVTDAGRKSRFEESDVRFQLAACTAEFAERLRRSPYAEGTEMTEILGRIQNVALELDLDAQVQELKRLILIATGMGN